MKRLFNFEDLIGETVTIFATCGGVSGCGFTGVIIFVDECFVRLVTRIGPPPGCALGNACVPGFNNRWSGFGAANRGFGLAGFPFNTLGSVVDIPIDKIAAFVHNAV